MGLKNSSTNDTPSGVEISVAAPYEWIHKALRSLPRYLRNLRELQLTRLPVLHPTFVIMCSQFKAVESLCLYDLQNQSFPEIVQLINRFPRLRSLRLFDCDWGKPMRYFSRRRRNLVTLELPMFITLNCAKEVASWVLSSGSACEMDKVGFAVWSFNNITVTGSLKGGEWGILRCQNVFLRV